MAQYTFPAEWHPHGDARHVRLDGPQWTGKLEVSTPEEALADEKACLGAADATLFLFITILQALGDCSLCAAMRLQISVMTSARAIGILPLCGCGYFVADGQKWAGQNV